ncbi:MAG TPA: LuxR C-terminal-related transcriptional regulator [Bacteroidales bacterium]|nr:LuxR C-terminal-related transcriptional regulator [Bacteroidales bacterium]
MGYLIFIISVALAAGGVVLSIRLRNKYHNNVFSSLLYYEVFIYTFGFYGIWGQVIIKVLLSQYISADNLLRISDIALLMGLPFLVFAWLMLLQFSSSLSGRNNKSLFLMLFLLLNFSVLTALGYYFSKEHDIKPAVIIKGYFIIMNLIYSTAASVIILLSREKKVLLNNKDKKVLPAFILMIMIIQNVPLLFYNNELWIAVVFIFVFFAGNTFLPVYFSYLATIINSAAIIEKYKDISFDDFCRKFDVSPRETDIIREICNGLSNKEIAEKLFISLQTVKDHSHRIYIKTNVRSRAQLITLVRELKQE